jgi:hypothetical protein
MNAIIFLKMNKKILKQKYNEKATPSFDYHPSFSFAKNFMD